VRPSHDTREETVARLRRGYLAGRMGPDTFVHRVDRAMECPDREELRGLTADLPAARPPLTRLLSRLVPRPRGLGLPVADDLLRARLVIGRSAACELVLSDDTVSRRHAELRIEDGTWLLRDLGSSNGTWVNGRRVVEAEVRPGDVLHLGGAQIRL
jgi:FHA domain-containing protein/uncharacterized protein DUF1707